MYLIFASPDDIHALAVRTELEKRGATVRALWTAEFPREWSVDVELSNHQTSIRLRNGCDAWTPDEIEGTWIRRLPNPHVPPSIHDHNVARFTERELRAGLQALLCHLPQNVINDPYSEYRCLNKIHQLTCAREAGLQIPHTLVSTNQQSVSAFRRQRSGSIIFKSFTGSSFQFTETRRLTDEMLALLPAVEVAPTIFQHEIVGTHHLRVTVVDDAIFAAQITVSDSERFLDWRLDPDPAIVSTTLDPQLEQRILGFMRRMNLRYGALDFVVGESGEVFLEVNPGGQYLFVEIAAGLPISAAIAAALMREKLYQGGPIMTSMRRQQQSGEAGA